MLAPIEVPARNNRLEMTKFYFRPTYYNIAPGVPRINGFLHNQIGSVVSHNLKLKVSDYYNRELITWS